MWRDQAENSENFNNNKIFVSLNSMSSKLQLNPPGLTVNVKAGIQFHPRVVTKVDKAFDIMCVYMQSFKTVTYPVSVRSVHQTVLIQADSIFKSVWIDFSMIPLNDLTEKAEQPRCKYEVLEGGPAGKPAKTVTIGQALYHKWSCESSSPGQAISSRWLLKWPTRGLSTNVSILDLWCMSVYNCQVDDGTGSSIEILNADGYEVYFSSLPSWHLPHFLITSRCAVDKYILQNLEYQTNLMAGQEAHAFKFADRVVVNFQCSIRIDLKPEGADCPVKQLFPHLMQLLYILGYFSDPNVLHWWKCESHWSGCRTPQCLTTSLISRQQQSWTSEWIPSQFLAPKVIKRQRETSEWFWLCQPIQMGKI